MRHALIIAGGSGTRLWPMSREDMPKQLLPFLGGKSLLSLAIERLEGAVPEANRHVCAGLRHRGVVLAGLPNLPAGNFIGEPEGRDTLNAIGLGAAIIEKNDPGAIMAVLPADQVISPVESFQQHLLQAFQLAESKPRALITFGIKPTFAATGYGYIELGKAADDEAFAVARFHEKPRQEVAQAYLEAGAERYLWNSGIFVWKASTFLEAVGKYQAENLDGIMQIANAWGSPGYNEALSRIFPTLRKTSVDYGVLEPAAGSGEFPLLTLPMELDWRDVGSWSAVAAACEKDAQCNVVEAERALVEDCRNTFVLSSDKGHLVAAQGLDDIFIIHTANATLVCRASDAEKVKSLQRLAAERFGKEHV